MATIDSKGIIKQILENNGVYPGDQSATSVWRYFSKLKPGITYAVYYKHETLQESSFVGDPEVLWSINKGLTPLGKKVLNDQA